MGDALAKLGPPPVERIGAICRIDVAAIDCDQWRFEAALDDARDASLTPQQKRAAYARAADARTAGISSTALTAPGSRRLGRSCGISPLGCCAA
jgi:hypothetical protein